MMWPELHCRMSFSGKLRHTVHARCGSESSVGMGGGAATAGGAATGGAAEGAGVAAGVVAGAAGVAADAPAGDEDDDAPEVRCFLLFLAGLASMVQSGVRASRASVFATPSAPGANADTIGTPGTEKSAEVKFFTRQRTT